jgi:hypothetical protein
VRHHGAILPARRQSDRSGASRRDTPTWAFVGNRAITRMCDTVLNNFWRGCNVLHNASPRTDLQEAHILLASRVHDIPAQQPTGEARND